MLVIPVLSKPQPNKHHTFSFLATCLKPHTNKQKQLYSGLLTRSKSCLSLSFNALPFGTKATQVGRELNFDAQKQVGCILNWQIAKSCVGKMKTFQSRRHDDNNTAEFGFTNHTTSHESKQRRLTQPSGWVMRGGLTPPCKTDKHTDLMGTSWLNQNKSLTLLPAEFFFLES